MSITIRSMSDGVLRERDLQEQQERHETKRIKAERFGEYDAPSLFMVGTFEQDIAGNIRRIRAEIERLGDRGDSVMAELCHELASIHSKLNRIERDAGRMH